MYESVGQYLVEWHAVGEQRGREGTWSGTWQVHMPGSRDCSRPVVQGTTNATWSYCEAVDAAKRQALHAAAALCAME